MTYESIPPRDNLEPLFRPRSIAVVGASSNERSQGYEYVEGLQKFGFPGPVYPVNPKLETLLGLKAYPRLEDIPGPVDFVISAVPAAAVFDVVEGAIKKETKLIHFFTARFSETGRAENIEAERELQRRVREAGIRVIGPNCMGVYYPKQRITFDPLVLEEEPGDIGFLSQSGSHAFRVIGRGKNRGLRFSKVISYGNALDLNEVDFLHHFGADPDTKVIAVYVEGVRDGRRFFDALQHAASRKPVVFMKGGRTSAGHSAASSHTAALAGEQSIWKIAVEQAGALEVSSLNDLVDMLIAYTSAGPVHSARMAVLGGAGGGTVEAADLCSEAGLEIPPVPQEVRDVLREKVPHAWDWIGNPVDMSIIGPNAGMNEMEILDLLAKSPAFDGLIMNFHVERALRRYGMERVTPEMIEVVRRLGSDNNKLLALAVEEPESREPAMIKAVLDAREDFGKAGIAVFPDIERAIKATSRYVKHEMRRRSRG